MRGTTDRWTLAGAVALAGAMLLAVGVARGQDGDAPLRGKPPAGDVLGKATEDVRSIFKPLYANKTAVGRKALTKKLLDEAQVLTADPVSRYAMFLEARDVAIQAGDVETAATAIEAIDEHYDSDALALRLELLEGLSKVVGQLTPDAAAAMAETAAGVIDEALRKEDLALAGKLLGHAESAMRRVTDPTKLAALRAQVGEQKETIALYKRADAMQTKLLEDPNNQEALAFVGRYHCFIRRDFGKGIPLLARTTDAFTRTAASIELKTDRQPTDWAAAGEAWLAAAKAEKAAVFRSAMARRAIFWYDQAVQELTGLRKTAAQQSTLEAYKTAGLPAGYAKLTEQERDRLVRSGDKYYLIVPMGSTWTDAAKWCEEHSGTLVIIESAAENQFVWNMVMKHYPPGDHRVWIGATDKDKEGAWRWQDGTPMRFRNFQKGQPDNSAGSEHYAAMYAPNGKWNDIGVDAGFHFVAQWKMK